MAQTNFGSKRMNAASYGARTGTGGSVSVDITGGGYYGLNTSDSTQFYVTSTSYYTGDNFQMFTRTNGGAGSYGANGNIVTVTAQAFSATTGSTQPADSINIQLTMLLTATFPETTNLTNSWGSVTIS
jgi:flagellar basal body rod protein FlgG